MMSSRGGVDEEANGLLVESPASLEAPPPVRMKTFLCLVAAYILPLAYCLAHEGIYAASSSRGGGGGENGVLVPGYLSTTPAVGAVASCMLFSLCVYGAQRFVSRRFRWKMREKGAACHKEDVFRMSLLNAFLCLFGRVGARLEDTSGVFFGGLVVFYIFFFGILFETVRHLDIEFTAACLQKPATVVFGIFVLFVVGALALNHFSLAAANAKELSRRKQRLLPETNDDEGVATLLGAAGLCAMVVLFHVALALAPGDASAHFHHWYTGFLGALFCVFDTPASMVAQAMLLGIYLHGAAFFGIEPCFLTTLVPDNEKQHRPKI